MNRQRREEAKKKKRERANRVAQKRRVESGRSSLLVMQAHAAWHGAGNLAEARRLLEKAVRAHPGSQDAHEGLAELHIRGERFLEGLSHYEQLTRPPEWPQLTYMAAVAAYQLGRFEQSRTLAQLFLQISGRGAALQPVRTHAKQIADSCRKLSRRVHQTAGRALEARAEPPTSVAPGDAGSQVLLHFDRAVAGARRTGRPAASPRGATTRQPRSSGSHPASVPEPTEEPDAGLPQFPILTLPELGVHFDVDGHSFVTGIEADIGPADDVALRRDYAALRLQKGFDELISIGSVRGLEQFWYQLETVRRLLRDFRGRVLLADEVGLGKTIEACLALKEYWMRGLVSKALILTPASLVGQWADELTSKFDLDVVVAESGKVRPTDSFWDRHPIVVASLPLARQRDYRSRLVSIEYDLVIVDEAHVLKKRTSAAWQLVNELKKRFLLLLSATPVGNDLSELYNLILLLKPGLLKTETQFRRDFGGANALRHPERRERLRTLLREVMIRNTRAHIDVKLPRRLAATEVVSPTPAEAELQEHLSAHVRARYAEGARTDRWRLMMLQMQAGSSPAALRAALDRHESVHPDEDVGEVRAALERVNQPAKTTVLIDLLGRSGDKAIVFTRFRATLDHLQRALGEAGFRVAVFHGGLKSEEKDRAMEQFEHEADVLVSSEVGGEGRNLQFCRSVINYDLPWNPMQLEQRVGRVHRIGQTREVFVFNLCLAGGLEEYILKVLHEKLNLFELVAGEIEMILGEHDPEQDFAEIVMDLWAGASTRDERDSAFDRFADQLIAARGRYQQGQEADRALFREEFEV